MNLKNILPFLTFRKQQNQLLVVNSPHFFSFKPIQEMYLQVVANLEGYMAIIRVDHWFKNIFMLPGIIFALLYFDITLSWELGFIMLVGVLATCLIASANYVINEWLDAQFDKFHPVKKHRPAVVKNLSAKIVYLEYVILAIMGLLMAYYINTSFFLCELLLLIMGLLYNVEPIRTKDKVYLDVLSESINNPIRFTLGWFIFVPTIFPPSSMLVAYWMGGAFLMGTKRFAEYRFINDHQLAGLYRKSFKHYTEQNLLISIFFYALTATFFLGIFLIKHRIELLLSFPLFALLFTWYLQIGFRENSPVQYPEKLYKEKRFMLFLVTLCTVIFILLFVDIPWLHFLLKKNFG
jgi:decaprenyl-phosphate phosphoribosyltransferase